MCDCLAWHPAWAVAAKRCGTKPGIVFSVFMALRHGGPYPLDARSIAMGLGFKLVQVALILSALIEAEIVDEALQPIGEWAVDVMLANDVMALPALQHYSPEERERLNALNRARVARHRARKAAVVAVPKPRPDKPSEPAPLHHYGNTDLLEEERDQGSSISSNGQARADHSNPWGGAGSQAELSKAAKAERWLTNTLAEAEQMMSFDRYKKLALAAWESPRPKWAQLELDRIDAEIRRRKGKDPPPSLRREPQFLLPIKRSA